MRVRVTVVLGVGLKGIVNRVLNHWGHCAKLRQRRRRAACLMRVRSRIISVRLLDQRQRMHRCRVMRGRRGATTLRRRQKWALMLLCGMRLQVQQRLLRCGSAPLLIRALQAENTSSSASTAVRTMLHWQGQWSRHGRVHRRLMRQLRRMMMRIEWSVGTAASSR